MSRRNNERRDLTKDGQPKLLNLVRFIFGVLTGVFLRSGRFAPRRRDAAFGGSSGGGREGAAAATIATPPVAMAAGAASAR